MMGIYKMTLFLPSVVSGVVGWNLFPFDRVDIEQSYDACELHGKDGRHLDDTKLSVKYRNHFERYKLLMNTYSWILKANEKKNE